MIAAAITGFFLCAFSVCLKDSKAKCDLHIRRPSGNVEAALLVCYTPVLYDLQATSYRIYLIRMSCTAHHIRARPEIHRGHFPLVNLLSIQDLTCIYLCITLNLVPFVNFLQ